MPELGKLWYSLNLKTKDFETAANELKKKVEALGGNITITGVVFDKNTKTNAQNQLNSIEGLKVGVDVKLHTNTLQAQLDKIKSNLTLNKSNIGGGSTTNNAPLNERVRVQERINRRATDELGIRRSINDQMSRNTQLATMFGNAIGNVFATYQIQRFLEALVHVGGEIQKQRMALGHIIGNEAEAMTLFEQMKGLAVKSPFGLLDLMQNARQLSAFGVQYNSLYDTMRRLSDVAAGLGIQFGRLSLAYGETMERGFLDGKLVRQFSYMGLPVLQKIAQYYTEINKAGNGQIFSATDVRKMVSNREVSFEDVDAVIKKMTDEGGQFANMQEVMAESVAGKWKNVADAIDIMYSNMVEGNSEILKAPAELLITLTRNYDALIPVLGAVGGAMLGTKAVAMLFNATLGKQAALTYQNMIAEQKQVATERQRQAALEGASIAEIRRLSASKMVTGEMLSQMVAEKKLSAEDAKAILIKQGVTKANISAFRGFGLITVAQEQAVLSSKAYEARLALMKVKLQMLGIQAKMVAASFVEMTVAMMANPMTKIFALVAAFVELAHVISKAGDRAEESNQKMRQNMQELAGDVKEIKQRVTVSYEVVYSDGTKANEAGAEWAKKIWDENPDKSLSFGGKPMAKKYTATYAEIQTAIDELVKFIKDHVPGAQAILDEAFATDSNRDYVNSLEERYEILKKVYDKFASIGENSSLVNGLQDSLGENYHWYERWWHALGSDDLLTDASDYEKEFNNVMDTLNDLYANGSDEYREMVNEWMKKMDAKNADDLFKKLLAPENFKELLAFQSQSRKKINILDWMGLDFDIGNFTDAVSEYTEELDDAWEKLSKDLKAHNLDPNNKDQKQEIQYYVRMWLDSTDASEWVKEHMTSDFQTRWGIDISLSGDVEKARDLLKEKWGTSAKGSYAETFEQGYTDYKDNVKKLQKLEGTILKNISKVNGKYVKGQPDQKEVADAIDEANGYITKIEELQRNAESVGMDFAADWKKEQDKKTTNKGGNKTDEQLKAWKEQFDELKKAYSEYSKWEAKVGKERAGKEIESRGLISKKVLDAYGLDIKNFGDAKSYKDAVQKFYDKIKSQLKGTDREKFDLSIKAVLSDIDLSIEEEALKKAQEKVQKQINDTVKQWDLYKAWFDVTGDKDLALQMSVSIVPMWDEKANDLKGQLETYLKDAGVDLEEFYKNAWDKNVIQSDMQKLFDNAGLSKQYELYKQIYDLIWKTGEEHSKQTANTLKDMMTFEQKIAVLEKERAEALKGANGNLGVMGKINASYNAKIEELDPQYKQFMSNVTSMTKESVYNMAKAIKDRLTRELQMGAISIEAYGKAIEQVDAQVEKSNKRIKSLAQARILDDVLGYRKQQYKEAQGKVGTATDKNNRAYEKWAKSYEKLVKAQQSGDDYSSELQEYNDSQAEYNKTNDELTSAIEELDKTLKKLMDEETNDENDKYRKKVLEKVNAGINGLSSLVGVLDTFVSDTNATMNAVKGITNMITTGASTASQFSSIGGTLAGKKGAGIGSVVGAFLGASQAAYQYIFGDSVKEYVAAEQRVADEASNLSSQLETMLNRGLASVIDFEMDNETKAMLEALAKDQEGMSNSTAKKALETGSYYDTQMALLYSQWDALDNQIREMEGANDKGDWTDEISDTKNVRKEVEEKMKYLAQDMMKELYSIDFKSWAQSISDSLVDAWANGEDAAKAYENTVKDLMKSVSKSVIQQNIIERALKPTLDEFEKKFINDSGVMDTSKVTWLADQLNAKFPEISNAVTLFLDSLKQSGLDLSETTSNTTSSSIKSISEETADILAAYINGMRLDLSLQRLAVERIAEKYCGEEGSEDESGMIAQAQLQQLQQIASNTLRNAEAAEAMRETLDAVVAGTKSWSIQ